VITNYNIRKLYLLILLMFPVFQIYFSISCAESEKPDRHHEINLSSGRYTIYVVNYNLHTGIIIPVENESIRRISALKHFKNYSFTEFGWGEEKFYQNPDENYFMAAKAILFPNRSVIRVEGRSRIGDGFIGWSDYTLKMTLTEEQYINLLIFIENSFRKDSDNNPFIASKKYSGAVIFFQSVYKYHLFNTCNTWAAHAFKSAGLDVSTFFIITDKQLYDELKQRGTVIKYLK